MVDFLVASSMQVHESIEPGHNVGHYHLGRFRRLRVVVGGRHSPGSHLLRQDLTVAPPQLLLYLTSSAGSRIQSSILMSSMMSEQNGNTRRHRTARVPQHIRMWMMTEYGRRVKRTVVVYVIILDLCATQ